MQLINPGQLNYTLPQGKINAFQIFIPPCFFHHNWTQLQFYHFSSSLIFSMLYISTVVHNFISSLFIIIEKLLLLTNISIFAMNIYIYIERRTAMGNEFARKKKFRMYLRM